MGAEAPVSCLLAKTYLQLGNMSVPGSIPELQRGIICGHDQVAAARYKDSCRGGLQRGDTARRLPHAVYGHLHLHACCVHLTHTPTWVQQIELG